LLDDGTAAVGELGIPMGDVELLVVENTDDAHNMIVCTLCSCYPRTILGLPPDWYKSKSYRSRAVHEPREVLKEFGTDLPAGVTVRVHDSNADMRYLVLPMRPEGTDDWTEDALAELVTRDSMVGTAMAKSPS
jgi:nitrile hydratase